MTSTDKLGFLEDTLVHRYGIPEAVETGHQIVDEDARVRFYLEAIDHAKDLEEKRRIYRFPPVSPRQFFTDPYFMGATMNLWPKMLDELEEACSGKYTEAVLTGGIGVGKTTLGLGITAYGLYDVLNLTNPHRVFDLDPASEIAFIMQSVTGKTAFTVDYSRLRRMIEGSPWFQENAPHDSEKKATIQFLGTAIMVQPLPGTETAAIGENVFGGMIDEVNHMRVVQQSARRRDGETHDQMLENYRAVARRRESRFQRTGRVPGMLCLMGSANYEGQFTDRKREERDRQLKRDGSTTIYFFDKRSWEVQPPDRFLPTRFRVFLGDGARAPRVLKDSEEVPEGDEQFIMDVPDDFRNAFESDLAGSVKDIAGIALGAFHKFIPNYAKIREAFGPVSNIFQPDWCDFGMQGVRIPPHEIQNPKARRYIHVDLALSIDNAALSMAHVPGFTAVDRGGGMKDVLPKVQFDGVLLIRSTTAGQIPIFKIKKIVFALQQMGYPIEWVSLDGFQSADFIQTMRRNRLRSGIVSLDRKPDAYMTTKRMILDGCISGPPHATAVEELSELVWVAQKQKVDHPVEGSKDVADTIAGCVHGLVSKRRIWADYGINPAHSSLSVKATEDTE